MLQERKKRGKDSFMKENYFERLIKRHSLEEMHYKQSFSERVESKSSLEVQAQTEDTVPAVRSYGFE